MAMLAPLPRHLAETPWPTAGWPVGELGAHVDAETLDSLLDDAFADPAPSRLGETHALVVVQAGRLVAERYWRDYAADQTYPSWSMAKSVTHALIGVLVRDGLIDIHAPADVPEWRQASNDRRAEITLDQLLRMSSGLAFVEDYVDSGVSDVIEMLFGKGASDTAAFAAGFPLAHAPDAAWSYSSGTSNIVARCAARALGLAGDDFERWMRREILDPIGMTSALPKFDGAGTFIGSSFCYATARDFAKFGLLYLRDGVWDGVRLLPAGWVDYARTPTPVPPEEPLGYGAHWWLRMAGPDSFSANGYQGQYTLMVPSRDLIIVRHGNSPAEAREAVEQWLADVAACFSSS